jgi:YHS domain-containing protein
MTTEIDPVCKMEVETDRAKWKSTYHGREYYFCAPGCKSAFDKDPSKFL